MADDAEFLAASRAGALAERGQRLQLTTLAADKPAFSGAPVGR